MSISVEGQKCPVCHGYMFDDDEDIVYCPVCGAPHHKECYFKLNHCAMEQFHGTEMEYRRPEMAVRQEEEKIPEGENESGNREKNCPSCGFSLPEDANFCPNCNRPVDLTPVAGMPFITMLPGDYDPYGGVKKEQETDGATAEEMRNYVVINTGRYIPKFFSLNKSAKMSWNWAAFLFPSGWFFYRKIYNVGIIAFVLSICSSLLTTSLRVLLQQIMDSFESGHFKDYFALTQYILDPANKINHAPIYLAFAGLVGSLIFRIIFGLFGDWFYRNSSLSRIKKTKEDDEVENLHQTLRLKGGISPFLAAAAYMAAGMIPSLLYQMIIL